MHRKILKKQMGFGSSYVRTGRSLGCDTSVGAFKNGESIMAKRKKLVV